MEMNCETMFKIVVYVLAGYIALKVLKENCGINLLEGFDLAGAPIDPTNMGVMASEGVKFDSLPAEIPSDMARTPPTCYPHPTLKAEDLLPKEDSDAIKEFNTAKPHGEGILQGVNYLDSGFHVGVNTVGQSLKNANRQLRAEPPNPQVSVSPWMNSSIGPDLFRRPLEDSAGCAAGAELTGSGPTGPGSATL
jgi:hypothetical protein